MTPPEYGSAEFHALPEADPARQESILRAAECWRRHIMLHSVNTAADNGYACRLRAFNTPSLTPEEIRQQAAASWAALESGAAA